MWLSHVFEKSQKIGKIDFRGQKKWGWQGTDELIEMVQYMQDLYYMTDNIIVGK